MSSHMFAEDSGAHRVPRLPQDPWQASVERRLTRLELLLYVSIGAGLFGPYAQKALAALGAF